MTHRNLWAIVIAGFCAGAVNGLLGAGGGMILVPMLTMLTDLEPREIFPSSISIILPICLVSLAHTAVHGTIDLSTASPYLIGSAVGGLLAGIFGKRIPVSWLHKGLGLLIVWGGVRYLLG